MKIEKNITYNVYPDGRVLSGGAVVVNGRIAMSRGEGCGSEGCNCSDGYWISITLPRAFGAIVESVIVKFDNKEEMESFFKNHTLSN